MHVCIFYVLAAMCKFPRVLILVQLAFPGNELTQYTFMFVQIIIHYKLFSLYENRLEYDGSET